MRIETIAEHQIGVDLLPDHALILDLGCLNFVFCNEMRRRGHRVYAVDIQDLDNNNYHRVAITNYNGYGYILYNHDKQATRFSMDDGYHLLIGRSERIKCRTLKSFMEDINIKFFDLIKMDVESSEMEIILSLDFAPAFQIEIEFHLHLGIYTEQTVDLMVHHLNGLGYETVSHEKTSQHGCGMNYWSSLFILKS